LGRKKALNSFPCTSNHSIDVGNDVNCQITVLISPYDKPLPWGNGEISWEKGMERDGKIPIIIPRSVQYLSSGSPI